jgi:outer membrane immunogenic protein
MLKKSLLAATAIVAFGGAALAADLPTRKAAPVYAPVAPAFTWAGAYFGLNAGAVFSQSKANLFGQGPLTQAAIAVANVPTSAKLDKAGFIGGAQAGYNFQTGAFVYGVEADISVADAKKKASYLGSLGALTTAQSDLRWLGTARLRAGYAIDRLLVYGTGGLAFGDVKNRANVFAPGGNLAYWGSKSDTRAGWTLGGGLEYAVTNNVTVKGEYLYYNLGKKTVALNPTTGVGDNFGAKFKNDGHIVRAGVNWKF